MKYNRIDIYFQENENVDFNFTNISGKTYANISKYAMYM